MDSRQFDKFCREAGYVDSKHGAPLRPGYLVGYTPFGLTSWVFFIILEMLLGLVMKLSIFSRLIESVDWLAGMLFR